MNKNRLCVIGLGKVGLPLACGFLKAGYEVMGVDKDERVVDSLNNGISHIGDEPGVQEILERGLREGKFRATNNMVESVKKSNVIIVIIPLLLTENKKPDYSALISCCHSVASGLKKDDLVCFDMTLPPGTTKNILVPALEKSGLKAGEDFFVAVCPERLMSGRVLKDFETYPKIIGGINKRSSELAKNVYEPVFTKGVVLVSDATTAETVKVFEGVYRDVNIGLANELMVICDNLGINVREVIKAANTQPYCNIHEPGIGVGGHCIPVYPYFIINENEKDSKIIKTARKTNESMPEYFVNKLVKEIRRVGREIGGMKVCVLGLAFRPYVKEPSNSPTFGVVKKLKELKAVVSCYDPIYRKDEIADILKVNGHDSLEEVIKSNEAFIIVTGYQQFKDCNYGEKIVVDGRNILDFKNQS